jgi:Fe-Mn family superoxide dismutase
MAFTLPTLNYKYESLEPFMDAKTVEIHYSKHHQTYCDKFNAALEKHHELFKLTPEKIVSDLSMVPEDIKQAVRNHGGGFVNHNFFWCVLGEAGKHPISGHIKTEIEAAFGSFDNFKKQFSEAALNRFGSGWVWLVLDEGKLSIISTPNQDSPLSEGKIPLLTIDVWEHAYYLKYQNRRAEFIESFWNIVNWDEVGKKYEAALSE